MGPPWIILSGRFGDSIRDPTAAQLTQALREVYGDDPPDPADDDPGAAHLRIGTADGREYVIEVAPGGLATFEVYADRDDGTPPDPPATMTAVPPGLMLELWALLARGDLAAVRRHPWHPAP